MTETQPYDKKCRFASLSGASDGLRDHDGHGIDSWAAIGVGPGYTIPPSTPTRRIDYVMLAKDWPKPTSAHVPVTTASDHLPLVIDVPLPP